ncbi:hypothetical protein Ddye_018810 [Dipteronia dyeriana]|uniref:Reverse transcriptase domain-containing protein n=1 Tax=Dipteronia dyeriana TaxID=168575 RepID=A0AAD9UBR9_9ROSI|nr:hypothetical protein Ddye_018810 [Dipteronia dyeriana]
MNFIYEFHMNASVIKDLNRVFIALIPKVQFPDSIKDFRPNSLVSSMYKVLAKVLASRLRKITNSIIGETQMAFISHRQIFDSFVIAEETVHKWRKDKEGGLLVKLDFEKAYDSVDHCFLDFMMDGMGFGAIWRGLVKECISSSLMSVLVNGKPSPQFGLERGLRQGDPLSPFLFNIVVEGLNYLFSKAFELNLVEVVGNGARAKLWSDIKVEGRTLEEDFPRCFALVINKAGVVQDFRVRSGMSQIWDWSIPTRRPLFDWEIDQWNLFLTFLDCLPKCSLIADTIAWSFNSKGTFTVGSFRKALESLQDFSMSMPHFLWKGFCPPKLEVFCWQIWKGRVMVKDVMRICGMDNLADLNCPYAVRILKPLTTSFFIVLGPSRCGGFAWHGGMCWAARIIRLLSGWKLGMDSVLRLVLRGYGAPFSLRSFGLIESVGIS